MTNDERMTKHEARKTERSIQVLPAAPKLCEGGSFDHSFDIRHSDFVIWLTAIFNQNSQKP
jgi:hypothetical protein